MIYRQIIGQLSLLLMFLIPAFVHSASGINMGPLDSYLAPGSQGAWAIHAEDGSVVLENNQRRGDITYFYVNPKQGEEGSRKLSVDVELVNAGSNSWAGLLYGYVENPKSYYLFVLQDGGTVSLYHRTNSGFELRMSQQMGELSGNKAQLAIHEQGNMISLLVNNREVSSFGNNSIGRGAVGIAAADIGAYRFSGFQVRTGQTDTSKAKQSNQRTASKSVSSKKRANSKVQVIEELDPATGMVAVRVSLPADWKKPSNPNREKNGVKVLLEGSDGVVVYENQSRQSVFQSSDPQFDQMAQQRGYIVEQHQPLEQLVKRLLLPVADGMGAKFIKGYKVPALLNFHRQEILDDPWYKNHFDTYVTEWDLGNGLRSASLAVQIISEPTRRTINNKLDGIVHTSSLIIFRSIDAPHIVFDKARDAYIASIANIEINAVSRNINYQNHLAKMAQIETKGKSDIASSWKSHNAKMKASAAAQATQQQIGKTYSDILDISHSGYVSNSNIRYAGHKSNIDGIHERTNIVNNDSGTSFSVQAGSKHYWVNPVTGKYIGTDNSLFDPRINNELSGQWEKHNIIR